MPGLAVVGVLRMAVVARLVWSGSLLQVICGIGLIIAFSMSIVGQKPNCIDVLVFASQIIPTGLANIVRYVGRVSPREWPARLPWLKVLLPLIALFVFGSIFIFANPDIVKLASQHAEQWTRQMEQWLAPFSPFEGIFWLGVIRIGLGLMRPVFKRPLAPVRKSLIPLTDCDNPQFRRRDPRHAVCSATRTGRPFKRTRKSWLVCKSSKRSEHPQKT